MASESCDEVSWASYLALRWINPLVNLGLHEQVRLEQSPPLAEKEDTARNTRRFVELLAHEERDRRSHPLIRAIFWAYWPQLLLLQTMKISQYLLGLVSPFILQRVLVFQEAQNDGKKLSSDVAAAGFTAVFGLICLGLFNLFYNTHVDLFAARIGLRIQASLRGCILFRGVQGLTQMPGDDSAKATTHGESAIYNVISFDAGDSASMIWVVLNMWILPIQFFAAFSALFSQVAWSVLPGLATIILAKTFNLILGYADGVYRDRLYFAKDERLGRCSEGFTNIRTLRMLAWTPAYQEVIMSARREELRMAQIRLWLQKMPAALDYGLTTLVTLVTLGYYVMSTGETLKASVALPVIALIGSLIGPIGQFPVLVRQYKVFRSAYDRLDRFLGFGGKPKPYAPELPDAEAADGGPTSPTAALDLQDCSFSWTAAREPLLAQPPYFELSQIDLTIQAEKLLAVIGQEGQGKSSMLLAMMGEMPMKAGLFTGRQVPGATSALVVPPNKWEAQQVLMEAIGMASRQCTAFAPQEPWIFAGTLRSNILFGLDMNESLYDSVLEACALKPDLASFPSGDLTDVAAGGSTISGGQRARVSLARAAYRALVELQQRQSPLVLLDDPFCALDKEVAKQVCRSLLSPTSGLLRRCTVMVAAADPWWLRCLTDVGDVQTGIVILRSGKIFAQGRVAELRPQDLPELKELRDQAEEEEMPSSPQMRNPQDMDEEGEDGDVLPILSPLPQDASRLTPSPRPVKLSEAETQTPLTKEQEIRGSLKVAEGRVAGHVQCATYLNYLKGVGYVNFTVMFVALAGIMLFQNFCSLWIVYWTSEKKDTTFMHSWLTDLGIKPPTETSALLKVYACLILGFFISNFAGHALEIIGGIRAAKKTFASALTGALHRPFHWWDTNPTGRVLNRFSEDVEVMDQAVTNIWGVIIGAVLFFLGHTMVLTFSNPMSIWLLPLIILLMEYFARYYRNTVREVQRLFLVSQSEVYQEMTDAITGGITIRAFAAKEQVLSRCLLNLEEFQRATFTIRSLQFWIGLRLGLVGFLMSVFNQLQPILMYYGLLANRSAALVGFSISYSSEVASIVSQFVMNFSDMEMQLVSIERLCEYAKPQDDSPIALTGNTLAPRAGNGGLELRDVVVKYQSALSPALAGVTLHFPAGETVAVVGRTGAGKSSLLLAVLQLAPYTGSICVDGQPLRGLSEQVCGTLVAVVPQQPVLFSETLRWNLDPGLQFTDAQIWDAIKTVGLLRSCSGTLGLKADVQGSMSGSQQTGSGALALSLGQRQLLCAARALLRSPKVALLDEVTAALPGELALSTVTHLVKKFRDINATTLLVTHQDDLVSVCDRTVRLSHGSVVSDTIAF